MEQTLGGWAISERLFQWIQSNVIPNARILELGSGTGSNELSKFYQVTCIEHDHKWLNKFPEINYIYAPIKDQFYDLSQVDQLKQRFDVVLIDGPPKKFASRYNLLKWLDKFALDKCPVIICDDINRPDEQRLMVELALKYDKQITLYPDEEKSFGVLI